MVFGSFIYSFNIYFLSDVYIPGPGVDAKNTAMGTTDDDFCPHGIYILVGSDRQQTNLNKQNTWYV